MVSMKVQLLYFDGCPHWMVLDERLRQSLNVLDMRATIERCPVESHEQADRLRFNGSPSVMFDGQDPFPSGSRSYGLTCRIYDTPDGPAGSPTVDQIIGAINEASGHA
jgi:hypothetical protein